LFTRSRSVSLKDEEPPNQTVTTRSTTGDRKKISEESSGPVAVASGTVSLGVMTQSTESLTATLVAHQITENDGELKIATMIWLNFYSFPFFIKFY